MSDAKVLHEWADCGCKWSVRDDDPPFSGDPVICRDDKEIESGVLARELARLAARVRELEDECAGLLMERGKLKGRTEQLEAAVRWKVKDEITEAAFYGVSGPEECMAGWLAAHPIVRSIIEKGGE